MSPGVKIHRKDNRHFTVAENLNILLQTEKKGSRIVVYYVKNDKKPKR